MSRKILSLFFLFVSVLIISNATLAQQGALDPGFNNQGGNVFGVYQDSEPATPDPLPSGFVGNYNTWYTRGDAYANGGFMVVGMMSGINTSTGGTLQTLWVRKFLPNGTPDSSFGAGGAVRAEFYRWGSGFFQTAQIDNMVGKIQPADGKIVVAARCHGIVPFTFNPGNEGANLGGDLCLFRFNQNGTLDTNFGGNSVVAHTNSNGGHTTTYTFDRGKVFTYTGVNNTSTEVWGMGGYPSDIEIGADGRIYVFGNGRDLFPAPGTTTPTISDKGFVAVYLPNGALQSFTSFTDETGNNTNGYGIVRLNDGEVLSNGGYVVAGRKHHRIAGSNFTGSKWTLFSNSAPNGVYLDNGNGGSCAAFGEGAFGVKSLRSNKFIVSGCYSGRGTLARYNSDLTLDTTFGINGLQIYDDSFRPPHNIWMRTEPHLYITAIQNDGKLIVQAMSNGNIYRFNPNGLRDFSFGGFHDPSQQNFFSVVLNGWWKTPFSVRSGASRDLNFGYPFLKPNGRILTAGSVGYDGSPYGNSTRGAVTQLTSYPENGGIFSDFNNDGRSDISVYRSGAWYWLNSFNNSLNGINFGAANDKPAPADYDGDGRTEVAVFRPSNGTWYIYQSTNHQVRAVGFGAAEDLPSPGDFNGDGQADIAVFRPSSGTWYILYSNPIQPGNITFAAVRFGQTGDVPLLADFDADGKSDIAVYRNGFWYYLRSSDGSFRSIEFGVAGDIPVAGDYDADGSSDVAVFRPSNGFWYRTNSSNNEFAFNQFGQTGDKPVPGDYDNDGKNDLAVFRNGTWFAQRSADDSVIGSAFGNSTDIPLPSVYLP